MSRRMTLPGADELFRTTGVGGLGAPDDAEPAVGPAVEPLRAVSQDDDEPDEGRVAGVRHTTARRRGRQTGDRRPSGRERHDEKITVYVSQDELVALEQARLVLRAEHGIAVDRGRLVREAVAEMLIDLETSGEASVVVSRLRPAAS
jgi:hypothetical protein